MLSQELRAASQIVALVGLVFSFLMLIPWIASVFTGWSGVRIGNGVRLG